MTRDEVLERLDAAGADRGPIEYEMVHVSLLRAAAEIIRESGWRPIAEFTDESEYLTGGRWDEGKWYEYSGKLYWLLGHRCTHARVSPAPPAREVPNDRG